MVLTLFVRFHSRYVLSQSQGRGERNLVEHWYFIVLFVVFIGVDTLTNLNKPCSHFQVLKISYNPFRNNVIHFPWTKSRGRNNSYLETLYIVFQLHMVRLQDVSYGGFQFAYVKATKNVHVNISSIGRKDLKGNVVFFFLLLTRHP